MLKPISRSWAARALVLVAWASSPAAHAQTPVPAPLTLAGALERALGSNPTIIAARLQRPVDVAGVSVARERPNPDLLYEVSKDVPRYAIGATIPIELGGKRQRRIDLAAATVATGEAELARVIAQVRNDVRRAYFEVVAADHQVAIADDVRTLATRARDAARTRVEAGENPQSDQVQAELALGSADDEIIAARGEAAATRAQLNALLGQPTDTPLVLADDLDSGAVPAIEAAMTQARDTNAELLAFDRRIAQQAAKRNLASALRVPDLAAGSSVTFDAQPDFQYGWRVNFGVTVPVFTTHRAAVFVEEAELARLKAERDAAVATMTGEIGQTLARAAAARQRMSHYQDVIVPLMEEAEREAQVSYSAGQTGLVALLQSLQTARDSRQRGLQASLDYQRALADLERAIGASIK